MLLQINPDNRMSTSEFYEYVTNENFLVKNMIAINNDIKYINLYQEICSENQINYENGKIHEKLNKEEGERQNIEKILGFVEDGVFPDIMGFLNDNDNKEQKYNNIIYFDTNINTYKKEVENNSDKFEEETNGAFILCTSLESLSLIKDEILKQRKISKKIYFNCITNGKGYEEYIKKFLIENKAFKNCINHLCIYCKHPENYYKYKNEDPNFIYGIEKTIKNILKFIIITSSKDIEPFSLTKLVLLKNYLKKYKERHKKISHFYGNLTKEIYDKNMEKMKVIIAQDEKDKKMKTKKEKLMEGLLKFDIKEDLKNLDELIIKEYTQNTFYGDLNRWLMKGKIKYYEPIAYFTSRLMYSLNEYAKKYNKYCKENKKVLHRGTKLYYSCLLPYKRAIGKIILLSAFTSTSENDEEAKKWAGRGNPRIVYKDQSKFSVEFHITNNYNKGWISNGIDIREISKFKKENEILFQPFSFYRVTKVEIDEKNNTADIYMETVGKNEILEEQIKLGKEIDYNEKENIMEIK